MKHSVIIMVLLPLLVLSGCQSMVESSQQNTSLYQQLGERSGIADIVEDLLYRIVEDERINDQFRGIDVRQFHTNLTDQLCELSGGRAPIPGAECAKATPI